MQKDFLDILTPQGYLSEIMHHPNLDVVMNLFKIPRAFAVSGFGDWSVGQHCFCVAYLALYWARHRGYDIERRNRLIVMGLTHDLHESATGDILPGLKTEDMRTRLEEVQRNFMRGLGVSTDESLQAELKVLDMVAFLFEIRQTAVTHQDQRRRLLHFFQEQRAMLLRHCEEQRIEGVVDFLRETGVEAPEEA
ncbi:MAG: HD domain-containing protein [SAR324 cluster bacterium]|nr:HD domain-containing protein [SAR324 cluster bacterium]MCZ6645382.1 HD domain-containing protein [SAR324 cluster bacterium]MCZ6729542.1 HD domain-containing protein [SAR324 cluster bacterium]MCZ6842514.1 HD domain-containing protein [SAR324 cluster bacterium]